MGFGGDPHRLDRTLEQRVSSRLAGLEGRVRGIERRGNPAAWDGAALPAHASEHGADGSDPITPGSIEAATQADLDALEAAVSALPEKAAVTIAGDGVETAFVATHNLGTRDVAVSVYADDAPYAEPEVTIEHTTDDTVTVTFAAAPTSGEDYRVIVIG